MDSLGRESANMVGEMAESDRVGIVCDVTAELVTVMIVKDQVSVVNTD